MKNYDELKLQRLALLRRCGKLGGVGARIEQGGYTPNGKQSDVTNMRNERSVRWHFVKGERIWERAFEELREGTFLNPRR